MTTSTAYDSAAQAYAEAVREFVALAPSPAEREAGGRMPAGDLAARAERLVPLSAELTRTGASQLTHHDPNLRMQTATGLLAKALTDLEVGARLLQAAVDDGTVMPARGPGGVRTLPLAAPGEIEKNLQLLLGAADARAAKPGRRSVMPADTATARSQISQVIDETLDSIEGRAAGTGQSGLSGLMALGIGQVVNAATVVGLDVAGALGSAEKVNRLYGLVSDYVVQAYNSVLALVGPSLATVIAQQVIGWINDVVAGEQFRQLLEKLYETGQTSQFLAQVVGTSQADLRHYSIALQGLDGLRNNFDKQMAMVDKLLAAFRLVSLAAVVALPQGTVLVAAAYLVLTGYTVLAGADYVDARKMRLIDRVPGVREVVEANLAG